MENWWSLRDEAMEDALIDTGAIDRFAGIDLAQDEPKTTFPTPLPSWRSAIL